MEVRSARSDRPGRACAQVREGRWGHRASGRQSSVLNRTDLDLAARLGRDEHYRSWNCTVWTVGSPVAVKLNACDAGDKPFVDRL